MPSSFTIGIRTLASPLRQGNGSLHVVLLHNPSSGDERHSAETLSALVRRAGHSVDYRSTAEEGWEDALSRPADLLAIAGGDGTVGVVLRRLGDGRGRPVTVIPLGSANNIARSLGLAGRDPAELVARWPDAPRRGYRLGAAAAADDAATFVETAGGGLFAESLRRAGVDDATGEDKVLLGLRLLRRLVDELPAQRWEVELDGRDHGGPCLAVEAMTVGWTGPNVPLAPDADPGDAVLDVVVVRERHRAGLASYLDARLDGGCPGPPDLSRTRCRTATLAAPPGCPLRIDDRAWEPPRTGLGTGSFAATTGSRSVEMLVP